MDLNYLLAWIVAAQSLVGGWTLLRTKPPGWRQELAWHVVVLAAMAACRLTVPSMTGYVGAALLGLLVVLPSRLARGLRLATERGDFSAASRRALALAVLRPGRGWRSSAAVTRVAHLARRPGRREDVIASLSRLSDASSPAGRQAVALVRILDGDWEGLRLWQETALPPTLLDGELAFQRVQALAECGDLEGAVGRLAALPSVSPMRRVLLSNVALRLQLLALAGRPAAVERLLAMSGEQMPESSQQFWMGTALWAAGDAAAGRVLVERSRGTPYRAALVARRLTHPPAPPALSEQASRFLDALEPRQGAAAPPPPTDRAVVTWVLAAVNASVYFAELAITILGLMGLVGDIDLDRDGAMVPQLVLAGEWWRLLTGTFLHAGLLHVGSNLFALCVLGPAVERALGRWRYLAVYLLAGLGSMAGIVLLSQLGAVPEAEPVVGASGSIMGLVGAMGALILIRRREMAPSDVRQRLGRIGFVVALQAAFDIMTPQVSFAGHLCGVVAGLLATLAIARVHGSRRAATG